MRGEGCIRHRYLILVLAAVLALAPLPSRAGNTGFKGVDVRQTGNQLVFRALLQTSAGALVTSGTTTLRIYELQSDGTIKTYDFNNNTFTAAAVTTPTLALAYQKSTNNTVDTGLWTGQLATLTGFTVGGVYLLHVNNGAAFPADCLREIQYGSEQGDLVTTANGTGAANLQSDLRMTAGTTSTGAAGYVGIDWGQVANRATTNALSGTTISSTQGVASVNGLAPPANWNLTAIDGSGRVDVGKILGTASAGAAGYVGLDWGHITAPTTTQALSGTTISGVSGSVGSVSGSVGSVTGNVNLNLSQSVPTSNTGQTVGDALNAARAQGFGAWTLSGTTLTLYAADGVTVVRTFTLNSSTAPTSRQ